MRGKGVSVEFSTVFARITPAYAGKRLALSNQNLVPWDHPRLCGEKIRKKKCVMRNTGSPPPMRGKVVDHKDEVLAAGITPAYAGKSLRYGFKISCWQDHPRLCGEKLLFSNEPIKLRGSPPPMRGKEKFGKFLQCGMGITPAYAGKRLKRS